MIDMPAADALTRYLSLTTQQMKLTALNMANQDTEGYTRRAVSWSEGDTVSVGSGPAVGVRATVSAQRDRILQRTVQQATETATGSSTRLSALNALQSLFAADANGADAAGIGTALSSFFSAASGLSTSPNDSVSQSTLLSAAKSFALAVQRTSAQMTTQTESLNRQVALSVVQVNDLAAQVAALNSRLANTAAGAQGDSLIDERDKNVTALARLIGVNPVTTSNGSLDLALPDGTPLVSGSDSFPLSVANAGGKTQVYAGAAVGGAVITDSLRGGGSIGGSLQARDVDIAAASAQLDSFVSSIANAINTQNLAGTTPAGIAGGAVFSGTTAATLTVALSDGSGFATGGADGKAGSNAVALSNLKNSPMVGGETPVSALAGFIAGLGSTAAAAKTRNSADAAVLSQTETQMDALTGVSLDVEGANLTQYQRSYQAAAKVLGIVNTLLAQAINLGQQTTVS